MYLGVGVTFIDRGSVILQAVFVTEVVAPTRHGVPLVRDPLPPLIAGDREFRSTHQGRSTDVLFWFVEDGETFGPQAPELQLEYFVPLEV